MPHHSIALLVFWYIVEVEVKREEWHQLGLCKSSLYWAQCGIMSIGLYNECTGPSQRDGSVIIAAVHLKWLHSASLTDLDFTSELFWVNLCKCVFVFVNKITPSCILVSSHCIAVTPGVREHNVWTNTFKIWCIGSLSGSWAWEWFFCSQSILCIAQHECDKWGINQLKDLSQLTRVMDE